MTIYLMTSGRLRRAIISALIMALLLAAGPGWWGVQPARAQAPGCSIAYNLPGDIGPNPTQATVDAYSWQLFLALNAPAVGGSVSTTGDNATLWGGSVSSPITASNPGWSSTDDLLMQVTQTSAPAYGSHYYPDECKQATANYASYRVIDELNKVDDDFFEATVKNLSGSPAIATNGTFLRYEILISPVTYNTIVTDKWYLLSVLNSLTSPLSFPCGLQSAGGPKASPADTNIGAITVKNAWMDVSAASPGIDTANYHTEKLLVFTDGSENSTGTNACELKTMALVGQHIAHKTTQQPAWTWSTFEHAANAPDCTAFPPPQPQKPQTPGSQNTSCPAPAVGSYNLAPNSSSTSSQFQTCNATPSKNAGANNCDDGFCADLAPNNTAGYSSLCRQVPLQSGFPTAYAQSDACNKATGANSAWSNYRLVSTQWFTKFASPSTCQNAASTVAPPANLPGYAPQVTMSDGTTKFPYLGNTTMESYERSVCLGCHQQATAGSAKISTDLMYFLQLEVPNAPVNLPPSFRSGRK